MKYIIVLVCVLAALLFALIYGFWLRSHKGTGEETARVYAIVRGRNKNFWSFHYIPVIISVAVVSVAVGLISDWTQAGICAAGAAATLLPVFACSGSFVTGVTSAYSSALDRDVRQSIRSGYRSGAVLGFSITGFCLLVMLALFAAVKASNLSQYAASLLLGAAVSAGILHTSGEVYSSAYALAVPSKDFSDRSGTYIGGGTDLAASYIASAAAAILLSEVAVATSGVTSTFTESAATRFPLMVYAAGIAGSILGSLAQRAGVGNNPARGTGIGSTIAGAVIIACSVYFSVDMMQSRVYAWAVASGVLSGLIISWVGRFFSSDSKLFMNGYKSDRSLGRHSSVVFNLGTGMTATAVYIVLIVTGIAVAYMFASYYGVALFAVGVCSYTASSASVTGLSIVNGYTSDILGSGDTSNTEEYTAVIEAIDKSSVRSTTSNRIYSATAGAAASIALFCAYYYQAGGISVDLVTLRVFFGVMTGIATAFTLAGFLVTSVKMTGRVALRDIGRSDDETGITSAIRGTTIPVITILLPVLVGLLAGVNALAGYVISLAAAGYILILGFTSSGMHYENTSVQALTSLIRMIAAVAVAFLAVFMEMGGFLFG